jgi:hypothetical protein
MADIVYIYQSSSTGQEALGAIRHTGEDTWL